jgi:cytochrome c oxidase subunit I+III
VDAVPQYVIQMPGPSWSHVLAAVFTAACFLLLTVKVVVPAICCAVAAIACCLWWTWELDKGPAAGPVDIGGGYRLPAYVTGPTGHSWWAMVVLMLVGGSLYLAYLFSYLYIWTVAPQVWPSSPSDLTAASWPVLSAACMISGALNFWFARKSLARPGSRNPVTPFLIVAGAAWLVAGIWLELYGHWQSGLQPTASSYSALVYMAGILSAQLIVAIVIMSLFLAARHYTGRLDRVRWGSLENTSLLVYYTVIQALVGLIVVHGFPRLVIP